MSRIWRKIEVEDIPNDLLFEGYYWYSHETEPHTINRERIDKKIFTNMPFIVEGNFFAPDEEVSISVKNIDGKYHIVQFELKGDILNGEIEKSNYIAHDLQGIDEFIMAEAWEPVEDELLNNMKTLVPTWSAFAGFKYSLNLIGLILCHMMFLLKTVRVAL